MQDKIKNLIKDALKNLQIEVADFAVKHPEDLENGDYSANVAMVCAKKFKMDSKDLAEKVKTVLEKNLPEEIEKVEVAGDGFVNFYLSRKFFYRSVEGALSRGDAFGKNDLLSGKKIMVEYTDPNPFKPFHIGHLMTNAIGESVARILEHSGALVSRANYQGDVGLHVAKAIYILLKNPKEYAKKDDNVTTAAFAIGQAYAKGNEAYEKDPEAKKEIDEINKKIYDARNDNKNDKKIDEKVEEIYDWGFKATMEAFEEIYKTLGTKFDYYFLESEVASSGEEIVKANIGKVFKESSGAVVFKGEEYDPKLHTRVFITSAGLPTYETKELGLTEEKFETEKDLSLSIVITAKEQAEYMKVVAKAISLIHPDYENKMLHITHGMMRFAYGKMSSREGNVVTGESLLKDTIALTSVKLKERELSEEEKSKIAKVVSVAALKYSILKQSIGGDIIYDFEKSISFEGDSGPYLQYSFARANSVLEKSKKENILPDPHAFPPGIFEVEKLLYRFPEIVLRSASEYQPHHIANFLIELARAYNSFYGNTVIVKKDDKTSPYKIALSYAFALTMKTGLYLLGITAPEKM